MSTQGSALKTLMTPGYVGKNNPVTGKRSNLDVWQDGAGTALDMVDPTQINLSSQFSITTATGSALDSHGADWEVSRRAGESDSSYRARILAVLPAYAQGPTPGALVNAVKPFTGVAPTLNERGLAYLQFPLTFPFKFGSTNSYDGFTMDLYIHNPNNVSYNQADVVTAVRNNKRAVATVIVYWGDGTTTTVQ